MVKEPKHIDFYTTGNEPSKEDFAKISELIRKDKEAKNITSKLLQFAVMYS